MLLFLLTTHLYIVTIVLIILGYSCKHLRTDLTIYGDYSRQVLIYLAYCEGHWRNFCEFYIWRIFQCCFTNFGKLSKVFKIFGKVSWSLGWVGLIEGIEKAREINQYALILNNAAHRNIKDRRQNFILMYYFPKIICIFLSVKISLQQTLVTYITVAWNLFDFCFYYFDFDSIIVADVFYPLIHCNFIFEVLNKWLHRFHLTKIIEILISSVIYAARGLAEIVEEVCTL